MDINSNDRCMRSISLLGTVASIGAKEVEVGYVPLPPTGEELPLKEFGKGNERASTASPPTATSFRAANESWRFKNRA